MGGMDVTLTLLSGGGETSGLVRDLLIVLGAAALISILLRRLHLAAIPGYLIVGAIIGSLPASMSLIKDFDNVDQISSIAVILLMFTIGLHLDMDAIRTGMASILVVGLASTLLCTVALWPLGMAFGLSAPAALLIAMALSMSSTAVSIGLLQRNKEMHLVHGRLCIGVAIVQDLLAIPLLALMPAIALWAGAHAVATPGGEPVVSEDGAARAIHVISEGCLAIGGIGVMLAFAKYLLPKLLREASWGGNTEGLLVASAGSALSAAVLTGYLGFGPALGAFLAGFMLSATPFRYQLTGQLSPMRDLFMAVFFTSVGIKLDVTVAMQYWWVILIGVALTMGFKSLIIGFITWAAGTTAPVAALVGLILCQAGEFSLVVLDEAEKKHIIGEDVHSTVIALVVISLVLTTPAADFARKLGPRLARIRPARWITNPALREQNHPGPESAGDSDPHGSSADNTTGISPHAPPPHAPHSGHGSRRALTLRERPVIIAGFGVVGRNLAEHFAARKIPYHIVDLNATTVVKQNQLGRRTIFGDIANPEVLESAGIHEAEAIVLTIPDDAATLRACKAIRSMREDIYIAVRTSYLSRAIAALEVGADHVTIEEVVTAQDMARQVVDVLAKRYATKETETPHL